MGGRGTTRTDGGMRDGGWHEEGGVVPTGLRSGRCGGWSPTWSRTCRLPEGHMIRGDQCHLMLECFIASQSEVIRAIVSDYSPCCGVPAPPGGPCPPPTSTGCTPCVFKPQFEVIRAIMLDDSPCVLHEQSIMLDGRPLVLHGQRTHRQTRKTSGRPSLPAAPLHISLQLHQGFSMGIAAAAGRN